MPIDISYIFRTTLDIESFHKLLKSSLTKILNELINLYLHKKQRLYCCFIDYQKAFDTINRSALWGKLIKNGINGKIVRVIYNMHVSAKSYDNNNL